MTLALLLLSILAGCSRGDSPPVPGYRVATDTVTTGPWTNRLITATSPYLAMHAHDPVDWHPWGADAFAEAKRRNVPIFLSIGYLACHWCHVMDEESFSNPAIAAHLDAWFVPVAVDREERPDVDGLYQLAVQRFSGEGGWPASVWLTPDGEPIEGGTYYPSVARFGRTAFGDMLQHEHTAWTEHRGDAEALAHIETEKLRRRAVLPGANSFPSGAPDEAVTQLEQGWDAKHAGWGTQKFPMVPRLALLLDHGVARGDDVALARVREALDAMDRGGIHDQLGGGFHRYTVDPTWTVPHFEKMSTDNALLLRLYAKAALALHDPRYAAVAADTAGFLLGPLRAPDGTFYSSIGATGPGGEGAYYTWTPAEVRQVLGAGAGEFLAAYGVTDAGNFRDGRSVLVRGAVDPADPTLAADRARLLAARAGRSAPPTDTKRVVAYNGLAIGALARAGRLLHHPGWVTAARKAATVLLAARDPAGRLPRTLEADSPPAIVDDYAFTVQGLLDLYEADRDPTWLLQADALAGVMLDRFGDAQAGGLWLTDRTAPVLLARRKVPEDGSLPSGEAVAVLDLWRLRAYGAPHGDPAVIDRALKSAGVLLTHAPGAVPTLSRVVEALSRASLEAVVATAPDHAAAAAPFVAAFDARYRPYAVLAVIDPASEARLGAFGALQDKAAAAAPVLGYVCFDGSCKRPTADAAVFAHTLDAPRAVEDGPSRGVP